MGQAVKISDTEMEALRDAARVSSRSISAQAEHWIRVGRAVERDPTLSYSRIEQALRGLDPIDPDTLADAEQDALFAGLVQAEPSAEEDAHWRTRQRQRKGVGLDAQDRLVRPARAVRAATRR